MIADVNGDGTKQVVTAWRIDPDSTSDDQDFNPFINDIWGSGEWGTVGETWSGGVVFLNAATGAKQYVYHLEQLVESGVALGHADTIARSKPTCSTTAAAWSRSIKPDRTASTAAARCAGNSEKNSQVISGSTKSAWMSSPPISTAMASAKFFAPPRNTPRPGTERNHPRRRRRSPLAAMETAGQLPPQSMAKQCLHDPTSIPITTTTSTSSPSRTLTN